MEAKEIRIGNYVNINPELTDSGFNYLVTAITPYTTELMISDADLLRTNATSYPLTELSPIFLTKEWLVDKLGFKNNGDGYYQHPEYNFFLYFNQEDEYYDCYKQVPAADESGDFKTLQHVHKLQNLFFELFDEELLSLS